MPNSGSRPAIEGLFKYVEQVATDKKPNLELVRQFLWLINAHPDLIALIFICEQLLKVIRVLDRSGVISPKVSYLKEWIPLCEWFQEHEKDLKKWTGREISQRPLSDYDIPIMNENSRHHCLYTVLCVDHRVEELRDKFSFVVGYFLMAYTLAMKDYTKPEDFYDSSKSGETYIPNDPYSATLGLRGLCRLAVIKLRDMIVPQSPEDVMNSWVSWGKVIKDFHGYHLVYDNYLPPDFDFKLLGTRLISYGNFVGRAFGEIEWDIRGSKGLSQKQGSPGVRRAIHNTTDFVITREDFPGEEDNQPRQITLHRNPTPPRVIKKRGLHPAETCEHDDTLVFVGIDCKKDKKGAGRTSFAALGYARHTAMRNQLLPWKRQRLSMKQLCSLLKYCHDEFKALRDKSQIWKGNDLIKAEVISLIHIMLWTASTLKNALAIKTIITPPSKVKNILLLLHENPEEAPEWVLPAYQPQYAAPDFENEIFTHKRVGMVLLPDTRRSSYFLLETEKRRGRKLFNDQDEYRDHLKAFLKKSGEKINITQIENYLFESIVSETHDIALAMEITNRSFSLGGVKSFYSTIPTSHIRETYKNTINKITNQVYKVLESSFNPMTPGEAIVEGHAGARNFPKSEAVRNAVQSLKTKINNLAKTGLVEEEQFILYHNFYTLYTLMFTVYTTGLRPVKSPFIPLKEINLRRGLAYLAEKEGPDKNKARLVWLPESLITQISHYEQHCKIIDTHWKERFKRIQKGSEACFFISPKLVREEVIPSLYEKKLELFLSVPANSHRKYIRMKLKEKNLSEEQIDAFMGHWFFGEEYWGKFSSFPLPDYISSLKKHLVPILEKELSFCAIPSILTKAI